MSEIATPPAVRRELYPNEPPPEDPFRYGWREVVTPRPDGGWDYDQVPLTLEDLLHPQENDKIPQSTVHDRDWTYLVSVLRARLANQPHTLVLSDCGVAWDVPGMRHHSPDISVIYNVFSERAVRTLFDVTEEETRPELIIEVVSPHYRVNDVDTKYKQYHQARLPYYVLVDREKNEGPPKVIGYRYTRRGWRQMPYDAAGRLELPRLGLLLGTHENRAVLYDKETGEELGDYTRITEELEAAIAARQQAERQALVEAEARQAAEQQAAAEAQARQAAEQQAAAEAQARQAAEQARQAAERQAAAEAQARQQAEARLAEEQARIAAAGQARADLEARLRELEAELQRRNQPPSA